MLKLVMLLGFLMLAGLLRAQCPDKETLLKTLRVVKDSNSLRMRTQLKELLEYEKNISTCSYRTDSLQFALLRSIRNSYNLQTDYIHAIEYTRKLIALIAQNAQKPEINEKYLIREYYWLSTFYDSLHNISGKMRAVDSAIAIALRLNVTLDISYIRSLYERVVYFFNKGDYHRCIKDAELCERLATLYAQNTSDITEKYAGEENANSSFGWYVNANLALRNYTALEPYIRERIERYSAQNRKSYLALAYAQLAELQWSKGNTAASIGYYRKSLDVYRQTGDQLQCRQTLNSLGHDLYYKILKNDKQALACYTEALRYRNNNETKDDSAEALNILARVANVYVRKKDFKTAFAYFQKAFDQVKPGANEATLLNASIDEKKSYLKVHYLAGLVMDKGDAYLAWYKHTGKAQLLTEAIRIYKMADALLNSIKAEQSETSSKLFWRYDTRRLYEHAIEACLLQNNTTDAFYFFEKSRAALLNDQLVAQHWLAAEDIALMVQMRKRLAEIDRSSEMAAANPEVYGRLSQQRSKLIEDIYRLEEIVKKRNPLYYSNRVDTNAISLSDFQYTLKKEQQVLLEIFAGDSAIYSLLVTPADVKLKKIDKKLYDSLTASYALYISDPQKLNVDFAGYRKVAYDLYNLIFAGRSMGRIIISPDGSYFPFEALITDNSREEPVYFVKDHAVSYTYSVSYLQNSFSSDASGNNRFLLGVAPVKYPSNLNLSALEGSDASLKNIHNLYSGYLGLTGAQASRDKFLSSFSDFRVVQLYTHAADSSNNSGHNEPVIYFADAPLYLSELIPQKKPATRLIVLSACETARGKVYQGEGVFSFNRGFAAMGIPSSITYLWAVENEPTYRLTELFYKHMAKGLQLDVALQQARLEFLANATRKETLPYYWSAAIMMGRTEPIVYEKPWDKRWLLLLVLVVPFFMLVRKYRKKNS